MRLATAILLGTAFGYAGVVWGTPLACAGAVVLFIPAHMHARRQLRDPVTPTPREPLVLTSPLPITPALNGTSKRDSYAQPGPA